MERLTHEADFGLEDWEETLFFVKSDPNGAYNIIDIAKYQGEPEFDEILKNVALRLAAYEDILCDDTDEYDLDRLSVLCNQRMTMREEVSERFSLTAKMPLDRLREIAEAEREGRCLVLPAGIGDTVYHITTCKNFSQVLDGTMYGPNGGLGTATGLYCPCELAETCPFPCGDDGSFDCEKHKNTLAIFEDVVTGILSDDMQDTLFLEYSENVAFDDFGKTVFLTREEAEAALAKLNSET